MTKGETDETKIALINNNIQYIQRDIATINLNLKELAGQYVTKQEFNDFVKGDFATMKRILYGAVGVLLTAFALAVVNYFLKQ